MQSATCNKIKKRFVLDERKLRYFCDCMVGKLTRIMHQNIDSYIDGLEISKHEEKQKICQHVERTLKQRLRDELVR